MRVVWEAGDNYRTSPGNKPRSAVSNPTYHFPYGSTVSYAWGYMITSLDINATFAQHIRPGGPMWMLEGHNEGDLIVRCGGTTPLAKRLEINRWYDIRVEVDYRADLVSRAVEIFGRAVRMALVIAAYAPRPVLALDQRGGEGGRG
jgi:hypothetical protein